MVIDRSRTVNRWFYILFSIFLSGLFVFKDFLILIRSGYPALFGLLHVSAFNFEEVYCYVPLIKNLSLLNLSHMGVHPKLTFGILTSIYRIICCSNTNYFFILIKTLFPLASFWVLFHFYRRYVSKSWATLFSFWGITFFHNFSALQYFIHVLRGDNIISSASFAPVEIARIPFPSVTFFVFILCFFISTRKKNLSRIQCIAFTAIWALNAYVYFYNFVGGLLFWFSYLVFNQWLRDKKFSLAVLMRLFENILVAIVIIIPYLLQLGAVSSVNKETLAVLGAGSGSLSLFRSSDWGTFLSYVLPILLTVSVVKLYCADYYEMGFHFTTVFIMITIELLILNSHLFVGGALQPHLYSIRIANFFGRFFYYLPVVYFASIPMKPVIHDPDQRRIAEQIHKCLHFFFVKSRFVICLFGVSSIAMLVLCSNLRIYQNHVTRVSAPMNAIDERARFLIKQSSGNKELVVSDDLAVNLFVPVISGQKSLIENVFWGETESTDIVNRLALYAKIYNWPEEKFLRFMLPSDETSNFYSRNDFSVEYKWLENGFGYWLAWHKKQIDSIASEKYREEILSRFRNLNVMDSIRKYRVGFIETRIPVNASVRYSEIGHRGEIRILKVFMGDA